VDVLVERFVGGICWREINGGPVGGGIWWRDLVEGNDGGVGGGV
jgi:hypothetical protein